MSDEAIFLSEMGFSLENSEKALQMHNNNVQEALEWLLAHQNELNQEPKTETTPSNTLKLSSPVASAEPTNTTTKEEGEITTATVQSLKCDDCGILLKDEDFATLHAHKTGHVNFSQSAEAIKPKTKEEIEEQKKRLQEKLVRIRAEKLEKERQDQIELEKNRRKQGRQINEFKQKFQEDEMKRIAEERRREKLADIAYKQKVKEQIAKDRAAQKLAREAPSEATVPQAVQVQPVQQAEKKSYDECKIQIRLTDGKSMVETFRATEQLAAVRLWIETNRTDDHGKFSIMQTFPRKVYNEDEMMMTLKDLGLVPASSLVITKS